MTASGWRWIAWSDTALLDKDGTVEAVIGVGRDGSHASLAAAIRRTLPRAVGFRGCFAMADADGFDENIGTFLGIRRVRKRPEPRIVVAIGGLHDIAGRIELNPQLPKVIRMHFVYDEVSAEKLRDGFVESIDNNIANFSKSADAQKFLNLFDFAAVKNDTIDMQFTPDDTLTVLHNGKQVGQLVSAAASKAVLNIYFGAEPIKSLKTGMLGD
jgi:hypothetical protein